MLQFSGDAFFWASRSLRDIRTDCLVAAMICIDGEPGVQMAQDIDERARKKAIASLTIVKSEFRKIGLLITADTAQDIESELGKTTRHSYEWLHTQIDCLEKVAEKELKGKAFFYIPPERAQFWPKLSEPYAFGKAVADSFPSCAFDANYAGIALAVGLSTASVFYLMRVLESGLAVLGLEFGVSLAHTNWQPAIAEIERKIRDMHSTRNGKIVLTAKRCKSSTLKLPVTSASLKMRAAIQLCMDARSTVRMRPSRFLKP